MGVVRKRPFEPATAKNPLNDVFFHGVERYQPEIYREYARISPFRAILPYKCLKALIVLLYSTPLTSTAIGAMSACGNFSHPM